MNPQPSLLTDNVAIITGGARGIGAGIARSFASFGARVVIADRKGEAIQSTEASLRHQGAEALGVECDVRDASQVSAMLDRTLDTFGRVDVLVNNVGGVYLGEGRSPARPFLEQDESDWDDSYRLNLKSMFLCTSAIAKVMVSRGAGGSIINVASSEALRCAPNFAPYAAYKAAMVNFTRSVALELARDRIRVNCIAPDAIPTETLSRAFPRLAEDAAYAHHVPLGRAGTVDEVGGVAVFLASELSSFVTGVTIPVEGGMLAAGGWLHHPTQGWTTDASTFAREG
jgi:NAD(P)-dependent dehydrogenase (short-subunit alcohol dehydrogenase family)